LKKEKRKKERNYEAKGNNLQKVPKKMKSTKPSYIKKKIFLIGGIKNEKP